MTEWTGPGEWESAENVTKLYHHLERDGCYRWEIRLLGPERRGINKYEVMVWTDNGTLLPNGDGMWGNYWTELTTSKVGARRAIRRAIRRQHTGKVSRKERKRKALELAQGVVDRGEVCK